MPGCRYCGVRVFPGAEPGRRRVVWALKVAAGIALFVAAFHDVDPAAVGSAFARADARWLAAAVVSVMLTVACVAMRWRALLDASRPGETRVLFASVIASQVANIVMPFKLGDAVRVGAVSRALRLPAADVLGSVAVERLCDALAVAVVAGGLVAAGTLPAFARAGLLSLSVSVAAVLVIVVAGVAFRPAAEGVFGGTTRFLPERIAAWLGRQSRAAFDGLRRMAGPRVAMSALGWSAAVITGSILTAWLVLRAFALDVPGISAAVVVIAVQIGGAVVPVPGAVGVSQVLTVQTLALWGVPEAPALAYALMLYLVSRVPKLAVLPFALSRLRDAPGSTPRPGD